MRAEKLNDLILNGGKRGKPAKTCEVKISFDNSNKEFPYEGNIFSVTRIVRKDGKSIYKINENAVKRHFYRALRKAGLRHVSFHSLRHSNASLRIASGQNIKYIQTQLGHASIKITMDTYGHLFNDVNFNRQQVGVFEDFLQSVNSSQSGLPEQSVRNPLENPSQEAKKGLENVPNPLILLSSPGRTRTADQVVNSHPLYRLSYRGIYFDSNVFYTVSEKRNFSKITCSSQATHGNMSSHRSNISIGFHRNSTSIEIQHLKAHPFEKGLDCFARKIYQIYLQIG